VPKVVIQQGLQRTNVANVIAHRGASAAVQENTLLAFATAKRMGADAVELDVRTTRDGLLVVHHDPRLEDGRVIAETHHLDIPDHVPALAEALESCAGMWVNVEIKNDPEEPDFDPQEIRTLKTVQLLKELGDLDRWLISSFRIETVNRVREVESRLRTAWLTVGVRDEDLDSVSSRLVAEGHDAIHPYVGLLTQKAVERFHAAGLQVNTWTCDDPARLEELMQWGVDGICTNVPDVAIAIRQRLQQV
jgi:glycerophosphoryl diester phosphodiesterase